MWWFEKCLSIDRYKSHVKAFGRGEKAALLSRKGYPELDKLVASINRLASRKPEPSREDREETD